MIAATQAPQRLGNLLIERGYITLEQLENALASQKTGFGNRLLGEILVDEDYCTDDQVAECLAHACGVPFVKLDTRLFDSRIINTLSREFIESNLVLPLFLVRGVLTVAMAEISNMFLIDEIKSMTNMDIHIVASSAKEIRRMIANMPDSKVFVIDDIIVNSDDAEVTLIEEAIEDIGDIEEIAGQSPVIRLVNYIIFNAVKEGASDIHIEPGERCMRVRYRIDGRLYKSLEVPLHLISAVTSRIKIMASLDISERRLPQDGRVPVMLDSRKIDLRVSTFPAQKGEKTVIRVLDTKSVSLNLGDLGFAEEVLTGLRKAIQAPNGIVLVTGPTGSGKTTTLYGALNEIASMENNVCSVEDPIEYHLPMINQFQVQEKVGLTFPAALRTLMRQDPDVIMVGEIRDEETARTAIQAALTGHLVFSTLHTNDAPSAVTRMCNMGIEPYLIGAAVNLVLAQRLIRRNCMKCRAPYDPPRAIRKTIERKGYEIETFYKGIGCKHCRSTGFSGRIGIHEIMPVDDTLRDAIVAEHSITDLRLIALERGMIPLSHDGILKVREGITSLEEILHATGDIRDAPTMAERVN